jgi:TolB-like protein
MADFFAELKRRHIYRVGAAYVVVAWVLTQVVDVLSQVFELPSWIAQPAIVLLAIGFPVTLIAVWMIEGRHHEAVASAVRAKSTAVDWMLFGAVTVLIAGTGYQQLARRSSEATTATPTTAISLAVLPFANLSGDSTQEFFSDGITEEITAAIARVQGLTVLGRTSAFQFKGQNRDLREIGRTLNATHLIEGSVRKAGARVRITAQLVRADSGANLWTENYDRELTDIFVVQENIAQAIASALRVPLGLQQGEQLVAHRNIDPESYEQFLRAKALLRARGLQPITDAITLLEGVVARHPGFPPAWAALAFAYDSLPGYSSEQRSASLDEARRVQLAFFDKGERAAREAIRLDAQNASGYAALASIEDHRGIWRAADDHYRQALALDPYEPEMLHNFSQFLARVGRLSETLIVREKLRGLEPAVPLYNIRTAELLQLKAQYASTIPMLEIIPADSAGGAIRNVYLAQAYAASQRYAEAADTLLKITGDQFSRQSSEDAARLLRSAPTKVTAPETLPVLEGELNFVYAHIGATERMLEFPERRLETGRGIHNMIWATEFAPVRKTERFKTFLRRAGLVEYWRERGWPDLCRPVGADDFVCE